MKFLFVAPRFHTNQHFWVKALMKHGHEVGFWVWNKTSWENYTTLTPTPIKRLFHERNKGVVSKMRLSLGLPDPFWYWREMGRFKPDVLIARDPFSYLFVFLLVIIARVRGCKIIFYTQTPLCKEVGLLKNIFIKVISFIFGARWITPAKGDEAQFNKFCSKAFYVPFAVESHLKKENTEDIFRIISVGKLYQSRKNHLLLLQAVKDICRNKNVRLTIIGWSGGSDYKTFQNIKKYIVDYGLDEIVQIKSDLSHQKILAEYAKYDLFVMPSSGEPLAYSPLEAMASGLPVILSDTNGARWYIVNGINGFLFKDGDVCDLRDKMLQLISDSKMVHEMGCKSAEIAKNFHSPEVAYKHIMEILESL